MRNLFLILLLICSMAGAEKSIPSNHLSLCLLKRFPFPGGVLAAEGLGEVEHLSPEIQQRVLNLGGTP